MIDQIEEIKNKLAASNASHVKVGIFDLDGVFRGKYMSKRKLLKSLESGFGFCNVVLGWDVKDKLYDNATFTGWHTGFPDANVKVVPETCRSLPYEDSFLFIGEFEGAAKEVCPRSLLSRVLRETEAQDCYVKVGFEYEFFVFEESASSVRDKGFKNLKPMSPGEFGYSVLRNSNASETYANLIAVSNLMGIPLEGIHEETGPGVIEAAIEYCDAMKAADRASLFKTFSKVALQREGKLATFMAKWNESVAGQSGHIHVSVVDSSGKSRFFNESKTNDISTFMSYFIGGIQQLLPDLMPLIAPNINSYKRLVPRYWAPTHSTVGVDNRTCAIRIIPGNSDELRFEFRGGGSDANPYIILSALIAAGMWGVRNKSKISNFTQGNAYDQELPDSLELPNSLKQAVVAFRESDISQELFGREFVEHYSLSREWEVSEYDRQVSSWELERYFEII